MIDDGEDLADPSPGAAEDEADEDEGHDAHPGPDPGAEPADPVADALKGLRDFGDAAFRAELTRMTSFVEDANSRLDRERHRGDVHIGTLAMFHDVEVGGDFSVGGGRAGRPRAARDDVRIDAATLSAHRDRYVRPSGYAGALRRLRERRLLVLAVPVGTGRDAAALNLLIEALDAEDGDGACFRVADPEAAAAGEWTPSARGAGHVIDLDVRAEGRDPVVASGIDEEWIEATARRVRDADGYLVVLTGSPTGALLEAAAHSPHVLTTLGELDPVTVFTHRVLGPDPDPSELEDLHRSLDEAGGFHLLARQPQPRTAVRLADAFGEGGDLAAAVRALSDPAAQVHAWFGRHRSAEATCFALAAAVLEGAGYLTVSDAAVELYRQLDPEAADPSDLRFRERLGTDHPWIELGGGAPAAPGAPSRVRFTDDLLQPAVLGYAWQYLDGARGPLLRWLRRLTDHRDIEVRGRAAVATGLIARCDLDHALHRFLRSWAGAERRTTREAVAAALGLLASEPELTGPVWSLLESWAEEEGSPFQNRLRHTAAGAVGGPLGAREPERALALLRAVLDDEKWRGLITVSLAMLQLVELGRETEVLGALLEWSRPQDDSPLVAQALSVFVFIATAPVPWTYLPDGGSDRPLLVADGGRHRRHLEELWARALARKPAQELALDALRDLVLGADGDDPAALDAIRGLLAGVAARGGRHRQRLDWYLGAWASDADRPSRAAASLRRALNLSA